jgi:cell division septal protein FtsQ
MSDWNKSIFKRIARNNQAIEIHRVDVDSKERRFAQYPTVQAYITRVFPSTIFIFVWNMGCCFYQLASH